MMEGDKGEEKRGGGEEMGRRGRDGEERRRIGWSRREMEERERGKEGGGREWKTNISNFICRFFQM